MLGQVCNIRLLLRPYRGPRHCLVSYDPRLYRNGQAVPFDWQAYQRAEKAEQGGEEREDSSLSSLRSLPSLGSLTSGPFASVGEDTGGLEFFDPEPIEQAFAKAHPDLARLYQQILGKRQRPKQRERNQCAVVTKTNVDSAAAYHEAISLGDSRSRTRRGASEARLGRGD